MSIAENLEKIKQNLALACQRSGRKESDVKILAVTKTRTPEEINEAVRLGLTELGENRVQEFISKYPLVSDKAIWHIIGHLQTNKVKYIADKVSMIHSVDSEKLAIQIDKESKKYGKVTDILIEINSGEENKNGIEAQKSFELCEKISDLENVRICGLMTMAPLGADSITLHSVFSDLRILSDKIKSENIPNVCMKELSMGMSGDYIEAIEEGATIIRPGRSLFNA